MEQKKETPMMRQFNNIKAQYPDALLLFRCGDFYETYMQDAVTASKILNITLTRRSNGTSRAADATEMAGFPFHALDTYLPKLVRAGYRVAICDQLEDPKLAKTLVKRGVTELVTPGVSYSDTTLSGKDNNWVCALHFAKTSIGIAFLDINTGEFMLAEGQADYIDKLISNFSPKEILFERTHRRDFETLYGTKYFTFELDDWMFTANAANDRLIKQFETNNLKGFGIDKYPNGVIAAGVILHYLDMTQHTMTAHIQHISRIEEERYVWLDRFTIRNLELLNPNHEGATSLYDIINQTQSNMGARMMHQWICFPLKKPEQIRRRQTVVEYFFRHPDTREQVSEYIKSIKDLQRIASNISTGRIGPRGMNELKDALVAIEKIKPLINDAENEYMTQMSAALTPCSDIYQRIQRTIVDAPPLGAKPGMIRNGVDEELDRLRNVAANGKQILADMQQRESEKTGIPSLKISFNNVFGYYIEVRNTYKDNVPQEWIRKQTLVNAERYVTPELKEYENEIVGAEEKTSQIELRIFNELLAELCNYVSVIQTNAEIIAQLDCLLSFAFVASRNKYVCPQVDNSLIIDIHQGRHPVIERQLPIGESYVPNDVMLDNNSQQIIIITGPNMAGKSALLRQTALIVLMAQIGCFVPAESAHIGIVDKIFTRVGASDNLSQGESTFMVEMNEAASILNNLSERSLVLFDELGRGTSTYDGISIAWSIVEYIHEHPGHAKTLFATHYHELNEMEKTFERIRNYNVSVREVNKRVIFLRKLVRGGSEHSFGIHVAKMAGMPQSIIVRAEQVLKELEGGSGNIDNTKLKAQNLKTAAEKREGMQLSIFQLDDPVLEQIRDEIKNLDINNLTPMQALNKLADIKSILGLK